MGPYSHYILAARLQPRLRPAQPAEYAWGAVIPDIRNLARIPRDQTHLSQARLQAIQAAYPHLDSFLLGYRVHCLLDQIDVAYRLSAAFPLNLLKLAPRRKITSAQATLLVEMYFLRAAAALPLSGAHNEVLALLGITPDQTRLFFEGMREYIASHSFGVALSAYQKMGLLEHSRLEKYQDLYRSLQQKKWLTTLLMLSVRGARLESFATRHVLAGLTGAGLAGRSQTPPGPPQSRPEPN